MEKKKTPDELLEEAKKQIGKETQAVRFPYPIEYEPIRRYCLMVDDDNPLFLDPEYAKQTKYGGVVYPPFAPVGIVANGSPQVALSTFGNKGGKDALLPKTPGSYFMNMAVEWEWFKPVIVGDWLSAKHRLADVYIKPVRIDPEAFWIVLEIEFTNQKDEVVCLARNIILSHRSPDELAASNN